jgi:murein DD-endopeptidase MepM/ murein hydrolase activator NlpD
MAIDTAPAALTPSPTDPEAAGAAASEAEKLRKANEQAAADSQAGSIQEFFMLFVQMLIEKIFGIELPEIEGSKEEYAAAEHDYAGRRSSEEAQNSALQTFQIGDASKYAAQLDALRKKYEGQTIHPIVPVAEGEYRISSQVGERVHPVTGQHRHHNGLDMAIVSSGSAHPDILDSMPGVVVAVGYKGAAGNMVKVKAIDGNTYTYMHMDTINVKLGQVVEQGDKLGTMGKTGRVTGVHLHYEVRDASGNVLNPELLGKQWANNEHIHGTDVASISNEQAVKEATLLAAVGVTAAGVGDPAASSGDTAHEQAKAVAASTRTPVSGGEDKTPDPDAGKPLTSLINFAKEKLASLSTPS